MRLVAKRCKRDNSGRARQVNAAKIDQDYTGSDRVDCYCPEYPRDVSMNSGMSVMAFNSSSAGHELKKMLHFLFNPMRSRISCIGDKIS